MADTAANVGRDESSQVEPPAGIIQVRPIAANNGAQRGHEEASLGTEPARSPLSGATDAQVQEVDIQEIQPETKDARGHTVVEVFFKRQHYAIYRAKFGDNESVAVQFSKDEKLAVKQQQDLSALLPLRNKLQYLAVHVGAKRGRDTGNAKSSQVGEHCYFVQVADAFRLGLESNAVLGKELLQGAIENVTSVLDRHARLCYLRAAAIAVFYVSVVWALLMAVSFVADLAGWTLNTGVLHITTALFSGAVGALLSVAVGIRGRTISLDGDPGANQMEAATRITIGVISAAVLYLLFSENIFTLANLKPGNDSADLRAALLIGFVGGFLERLVPDVIEKTMSKTQGKAEHPSVSVSGTGH